MDLFYAIIIHRTQIYLMKKCFKNAKSSPILLHLSILHLFSTDPKKKLSNENYGSDMIRNEWNNYFNQTYEPKMTNVEVLHCAKPLDRTDKDCVYSLLVEESNDESGQSPVFSQALSNSFYFFLNLTYPQTKVLSLFSKFYFLSQPVPPLFLKYTKQGRLSIFFFNTIQNTKQCAINFCFIDFLIEIHSCVLCVIR
jgi:hypothetical protein